MLGTGSNWDWKNGQRTVTDAEGNYRFTKLAAGSYTVIPHAPAYVLPLQGQWGGKGKLATLKDGEKIGDFDFKLLRGGVITGRVSDANNQPVMEQQVRLEMLGEANSPRTDPWRGGNWNRFRTNDQGVYRIYGLPPGRYLVSFGADKNDRSVSIGAGTKGGFYELTFHPGTKDKNEAKIVELTEGAEAAGVDIKLGERAKSFTISGRVVDADTNKPVPRVYVAFGVLADGKRIGASGAEERSDAQGQFKMEGMKPARYAIFAAFWDDQETEERASEPLEVEITDSDVADLEVKVRRGAKVSGTVFLEGVSDPAIQAKFAKYKIGAYAAPLSKDQLVAPSWRQATPGADGSFRVVGLNAGKLEFSLAEWPRPRGFTLARVERDGAPVGEAGLQVNAGDEITGVRVVFVYNTGSVRGRVEVTNGALAEGVRLVVSARRLNAPGAEEHFADNVDARNNFVIEGLGAGEYEIILRVLDKPNVYDWKELPVRARQRVKVANGAESEAALTLDLSKTDEGGKP
jgi:protocatechuate 3,4-dioxygenase beta subunit